MILGHNQVRVKGLLFLSQFNVVWQEHVLLEPRSVKLVTLLSADLNNSRSMMSNLALTQSRE